MLHCIMFVSLQVDQAKPLQLSQERRHWCRLELRSVTPDIENPGMWSTWYASKASSLRL